MVTEAAVKVNMWKFASLQQMDDNLHSIGYVGVKQYGTMPYSILCSSVLKCIVILQYVTGLWYF